LASCKGRTPLYILHLKHLHKAVQRPSLATDMCCMSVEICGNAGNNYVDKRNQVTLTLELSSVMMCDYKAV